MDDFPVHKRSEFSVLCFDFGTRRIGSAFGQTLLGTASPLTAIPARDGRCKDVGLTEAKQA